MVELKKGVSKVVVGFLVGISLLVPAAASAGESPKDKSLVGTINLNTATIEQLEMLPGVGPAKAQRILDARSKKPFAKPWEITRAKGIGPAFYKRYRDKLRVDGETTLAWVDKGSAREEVPVAAEANATAQAP